MVDRVYLSDPGNLPSGPRWDRPDGTSILRRETQYTANEDDAPEYLLTGIRSIDQNNIERELRQAREKYQEWVRGSISTTLFQMRTPSGWGTAAVEPQPDATIYVMGENVTNPASPENQALKGEDDSDDQDASASSSSTSEQSQTSAESDQTIAGVSPTMLGLGLVGVGAAVYLRGQS